MVLLAINYLRICRGVDGCQLQNNVEGTLKATFVVFTTDWETASFSSEVASHSLDVF